MILANHGIVSSSGALSFDADALAFITAASITDITQKTAVNTLVTDLKGYNIWTKMKAIYPFVGGTATSHRYNLKAPTTNASDYYLIPNGGITHSSTGVTFNGTTGYYNTQLVANTLTLNSTHISSYIRDFLSGYTGFLVGSNVTSRLWLAPSFSGTQSYFQVNNNNVVSGTRSNSGGLWLATRTTSTNELAYNQGTLYVNKTENSTALDTGSISIGARNNGANVTNYYTGTMCFSSIGDGLDSTESTAFYNAVQTFQTTLGRQV